MFNGKKQRNFNDQVKLEQMLKIKKHFLQKYSKNRKKWKHTAVLFVK